MLPNFDKLSVNGSWRVGAPRNPTPGSRSLNIVFYAEHDHYSVGREWKELVETAKSGFDHVLIETAADEKLLDGGFKPKTDLALLDTAHSSTYDASHSAISSRSPRELPFDVRHLLDIPIGGGLSDVLTNAAAMYGMDLHPAFVHVVKQHYVRNLLQPSIPYLNMLASLETVLTADGYKRLKQLYHDVLNEIQTELQDWSNTLQIALSQVNPADRADTFSDLLELIMFRLPAMLTDVYLVGLVMSKASKSVMVVCGEAHAEYASQKLKAIYGEGCCEIVYSSSSVTQPVAGGIAAE